MSDLDKLQAAYEMLKTGTLWSSTGKCKGYAPSNPAEAQKIDAYVAALVAGGMPLPPALATRTGRGIVGLIDAGFAAPPPPPPPPPTAGLFMSKTGSDATGDGSQLKPWATLTKLRDGMRSGPKVGYVRGGQYKLPVAETLGATTCGLRCTAEDFGQTYMPFENEPVGLDCSAVRNGLVADGSPNVTFDGLELFGFLVNGIGVHGGGPFYSMLPGNVGQAKGVTIRNCNIHDGSTLVPSDFSYGGSPIFARGNIPGLTIVYNAAHHVPKAGVNIAAGDAPPSSMQHYLDDMMIRGNVTHDTCSTEGDAGGIYWQDTSATSVRMSVLENFVRDCGPGRGLYADDGTSYTEVARNIVAGIFDIACMIHGGRMNKWHSNLVDLEAFSTNGPRVMRFQGSSVGGDHAGNEWTNNIVISKAARWPVYWNEFPMLIRDNLYHTYAGAKIDPSGDTNPVWADPLLSGPLYTLAATSPAFAAPVSCQPFPTHWGPPGYVIPAGTPPSYA